MPLLVKDLEVKHLEQKIRDVTFSTLCALVQLLDLKDLTTGVHSSRLVEWAITISKLLEPAIPREAPGFREMPCSSR